MAMPRGTPTAAARTKPCTTRSRQPEAIMVMGSARKVRSTKPPRVAAPQARENRTKKAMPRPIRAVRETGTRGVSIDAGPGRPVPPSLDEACVDGGGDVRHALDDAEFDQEIGRLLAEGLEPSVEELLVRLA